MTINEGRRCALPGCYVIIEPEPDGRPQRKYCTAAHRAVARQMRRESTHRSANAPPLPFASTPAADLPLPPRATAPAIVSRRRELAMAAMRRCRAVAVLGSAGLLVTGGGLMAASAPSTTPPTTSTSRPLGTDAESEQIWLTQAKVTVASLDTQLTEVDKAEKAWHALPRERRFDPKPIPIRNLESRRLQLTQQSLALRNQIDAFQSVGPASRSVQDLNNRLESLDHALSATSRRKPNDPSLARSDPARRQLAAQRDQIARRRDTKKTELDGLRDDLHKAMSTPLSQDDSSTRSITSQVKDLIGHPERDRQSREPNQSSTQVHRPEVIGPREHDDPEADQVGNGAPPNPGKSRPEAPSTPEVLIAPAQPTVPVPTVPRPGDLAPGDLTPGNGPTLGSGRVLADGVTPPRLGPPAAQPTARGPLHGAHQDTVKLPAVGVQRPGAQAPQRSGGVVGIGGSVGGAVGDTVGGTNGDQVLGGTGARPGTAGGSRDPLNSPTQPLNVVPTQPRAGQPGIGRPDQAAQSAPGRFGQHDRSVTGATQPINVVPSLDNRAGGRTGSASTNSSGSNHDGLGGIGRPVERVADTSTDSAGTNPRTTPTTPTTDTGAGGWSDTPTSYLPRTSDSSGSSYSYSYSYTDQEKAQDAGRIADSAMSGDMDDLVSSAMEAGGHAEQADRSDNGSSSSSSDSDDIRDSILESYGVDSDSDSSYSDRYGSSDDSSGGGSDHIDNVIDHYSDGYSNSRYSDDSNSLGSDSDDSDADTDRHSSGSNDNYLSYADLDSDGDSGDSGDDSYSYSSYYDGGSRSDRSSGGDDD